MSTADTRARLVDGALAALRTDGIAGLSARGIARHAGVNQALIFYHFGGVAELVDAAARTSVEQAVERHRVGIAGAGSFAELLAVGRRLHEVEHAAGNVAVMAQLTAGAQRDPVLAAAARHCLEHWVTALEPTVRRLLAGSPLDGLVDHRGLARAVGAAFLGLELYEGVDAVGARSALEALGQLGAVLEAVDELGPVARRAVRARLRRGRRT